MPTRKGDRGENVEDIQRALQRNGFDVDADGIFGSGTDTALREFQRRNGLNDDGVAGPRTLAALGVGPGTTQSAGDVDITFGTGDVDVPPVVARHIEEFAGGLERQFGQARQTSQAALENFQTTMLFASTEEADPDILGTIVSRVFSFAVDEMLSRLGTFVPGLTQAKGILGSVIEELERAGRAKTGAATGEWIKGQRDALARLSFARAAMTEEVSLGYLEAADRPEYADALFAATEQLGASPLLDVSDLEIKLYEEWINAHFRELADDASGCIEYRYEFDDNTFDFVSCTVQAPAGDKLASALNRVFDAGQADATRPIDLRVRKRACFRTDNINAGGKSWYCGWLTENNDVIHVPITDAAAQAFREPIWRHANRFRK